MCFFLGMGTSCKTGATAPSGKAPPGTASVECGATCIKHGVNFYREIFVLKIFQGNSDIHLTEAGWPVCASISQIARHQSEGSGT